MNAASRGSIRDWLLARIDKRLEVARGEYERCSGDIGGYRAAQARLNTWLACRAEIIDAFKEGEKRDG